MNTDPANEINRRSLLKSMGSAVALAALNPSSKLRAESVIARAPSNVPMNDPVRELLKAFAFTEKDVDSLLLGELPNYISRKYDSILGYVFWNCRFANGLDHSTCTYTYEPSPGGTVGARLMIANVDKPCRVNTYGDSFTHGDQVSDGETWQERLAAHLGEPIRNFGIGFYSVYQAYLRMRREELRTPAEYIIVTIYDDDHRRSLQPFIPGWAIRPYLTVDADAGMCQEHVNPCPTPRSVYQLCNLEWLCGNFNDFVRDYLKKYSTAGKEPEKQSDIFKEFYYGLTPGTETNTEALIRDALLGSMYLVQKIEAFAASTGKKVMYVLAYGTFRVRETLVSGQRFDQTFVDFLRKKTVPFVDLMDLHAKDFAMFKIGIDDYLNRYYVNNQHYGRHYNPLGNEFRALAMKEQLLTILNPKPPAYPASEV